MKQQTIWILQTGEPLHIDSGNPRPMRAMNLSNKLVAAGHKVVLWTSAFNHQNKQHRSKIFKIIPVNDSLEIRLIPSIGYERNIGLMRLIDHAQLALNLRKYLKSETTAPDAAFIGYPPIETAAVLSKWLKNRNVPIVLDVKDLWPSMFVDALPRAIRPVGRIALHPYFYFAKRTIGDSDSISAMAPAFLKWVLDFANKKPSGLDRVFRLTTPVNSISKEDIGQATTWLEQKGISQHGNNIFFAGSFMSVFDFAPVKKAAEELNKANIKCQFILCGSGHYINDVKKLMKDLPNVIFPGWIDRPKIEALAKISLASLAPYKNIDNYTLNTPNKIVDSLALSLPILSPLKGEVENLISKYNIGFTYGDKKTLEMCILSLVHDNEMANTLSFNSRQLYESQFEFNLVYDNIVSHIENLMELRHG